jgi:NAD-dependent dihydropyrimidine dehydrogenase PreA subunit
MITFNSEKCIGCGDCAEVCPQQCFTMGDDRKSIYAFPHRCMECGACKLNCRGGAISVDAGPGCFIYIAKEQLFRRGATASSGGCC